jgi:hypothetical protein
MEGIDAQADDRGGRISHCRRRMTPAVTPYGRLERGRLAIQAETLRQHRAARADSDRALVAAEGPRSVQASNTSRCSTQAAPGRSGVSARVRSKSIAVGMIAVIVARFAVVLTLNTLGQIRCGRRLFGEKDQYWSLSTVAIDSR